MAEAKKRGRKKMSRYTPPKMDFTKVNLKAKDYQRQVYAALHFAQYEMTNKALAAAVFAYVKNAKMKKADILALRALDDKSLEVLGKYAAIANGGGELSEDLQAGFDKLLEQKLEHGRRLVAEKKAEAKQAEKTNVRKMTVQDRMREQAADVACEFDALLDQLAKSTRAKADGFDPLAAMQKAELKAGQARYVKAFYEDELAELNAVLEGKDADLKEGYSNLKKTQVKRMVKVIEDILTAAAMISTVTKAKRAPRKRKAMTVEKQVERIKFKAQDKDYGIASEAPSKIVGAKEVWVFNTKNRKLGRYIAKDETGLSCKGAYITEFAETSSVQKTLRKPKEQMASLMKAGKVQLRKFMDEIRAVDTKLNGKMNEHIVVLRVVK